MIALCAIHHAAADAGAFTNEQLLALKRANHTQVQSSFQWRRKHTVFACGGNFAYRCGSMLRVGGIDIIYFEKDEYGFDTLSLNIHDICMNRIFSMRMNDWIARINVDDIESPPSAQRLTFKSAVHQVDIRIEFKDRAMLSSHDEQIATRFGIPADENVVFCFFTGSLPAPVPVKFTNRNIQFQSVTMEGNCISNCNVGIQVG
jgi:hypothetical protein